MRLWNLTAIASAVLALPSCGETPVSPDDLLPVFAKGGGKGPPGGNGDPAVTYGLLPLGSAPAVYGDGDPYETLAQDCSAGRSITLVEPEGIPAEIGPPAVCPESNRVSIHLPGDPLADPDGPFGAAEPSFTTNKNGKVRATGWMNPTFNFFWACEGLGQCNFVWTDATKSTDPQTGVVTVTGSCARLYAGDVNPVPWEPEGVVDTCDAQDGVSGFPVAITVTIAEAA